MAVIIQTRNDTAANWTSVDPILAQGELGYETDTALFKIGDGSTTWTSLVYVAIPTVSATPPSSPFTGQLWVDIS